METRKCNDCRTQHNFSDLIYIDVLDIYVCEDCYSEYQVCDNCACLYHKRKKENLCDFCR
jgi:hypothetical protein